MQPKERNFEKLQPITYKELFIICSGHKVGTLCTYLPQRRSRQGQKEIFLTFLTLLHWIWRHDLKYMIMSSSRPPQHEATSAFDNWQPLKVPVTELRLYHTRRESVRQFGLFLVTRTIFVEKTCWAGGAGWNKEQHTTKYKKVGNANLTWPRKSFHHKLFQQIQTFEKNVSISGKSSEMLIANKTLKQLVKGVQVLKRIRAKLHLSVCSQLLIFEILLEMFKMFLKTRMVLLKLIIA